MAERAIDPPSSAFSWVGAVAAFVLGAIFLVAAYGKAIDPAAFADQIQAEGLAFLLPAEVVALLALALEGGLGVALVLNVRRPYVLVPTLGLVLFFLFLTGRSYWLFSQGVEPTESCGCFGNLLERTPAEAFWQDLFLLGLPMIFAFWGWRRTPRWPVLRLAVSAAAALAFSALGWMAPELPLDDLATRLRPGVQISEICAGKAEPGERICLDTIAEMLEEGEYLVVIADLDEALGEQLTILEERAGEVDGGLVVLSASDKEAKSVFYWQWGPTFEIFEEVPKALLRPLYRELPRSFLVVDGTVQKTWAGWPEG